MYINLLWFGMEENIKETIKVAVVVTELLNIAQSQTTIYQILMFKSD